jgi:hypothetical protein
MADLQGFSNTSWERTLNTTIADHIKGEESAWMRSFQMGALLESNGRISYNHSGEGFTWQVRYRAHQIEGNTGETPRNFARRNLWKTAALPFRGYQVTDAIYYKELRANRGEQAIVNLVDGFVGRLEASIKHGLATEFYVDGNATGNEQGWHGIESMMATNGTVTITDGTQRSANAADTVGYPNDTYATLSTVLGNYGGEDGESIWPLGIADSEYDFWSPLIVNTNSTNAAAFPASTDTWAGQGNEVMRYGIIHSQRNASQDGQMTNIFLNRGGYHAMLNLLDGTEQINVTSENELRALGFKNTFVFDGVTVSWETGIPNTCPHAAVAMYGYGFNWNNIELRSMEETLFRSEGLEYDIDTQSHKAAVSTLSNLRFSSPRNFVKFVALA